MLRRRSPLLVFVFHVWSIVIVSSRSSLSCPERFIHNVVNQLGRHRVDMESLMGKDLDHLADVITGALRQQTVAGAPKGSVADDSRVNVGDYGEPLKTMELNQEDQDLKSDKGQELKQKEAQGGEQQGWCLIC